MLAGRSLGILLLALCLVLVALVVVLPAVGAIGGLNIIIALVALAAATFFGRRALGCPSTLAAGHLSLVA